MTRYQLTTDGNVEGTARTPIAASQHGSLHAEEFGHNKSETPTSLASTSKYDNNRRRPPIIFRR